MKMPANSLLSQPPAVLNIGIDGFNDSIRHNGGQVDHLGWRPPGNADPVLAWNLARLMDDPRIAAARGTARVMKNNEVDAALRLCTSSPISSACD